LPFHPAQTDVPPGCYALIAPKLTCDHNIGDKMGPLNGLRFRCEPRETNHGVGKGDENTLRPEISSSSHFFDALKATPLTHRGD